MFLAGGLCLCFLQALASRRMALPLAAGVGAVGVSGLEAVVGVLGRRFLHVAVWDYSAEWGNLAGLICPRYCFYWFFALRLGGGGAAPGQLDDKQSLLSYPKDGCEDLKS